MTDGPSQQADVPNRVYFAIPPEFWDWPEEQQREWINAVMYPAARALPHRPE